MPESINAAGPLDQSGSIPPTSSATDPAKEIIAMKNRIQQLQDEASQQQKIISELTARNERLLLQISRSLFTPGEYDQFDPAEYTVPVADMLANAKQRLASK
jgi:hypothetical protein